MLDKEETNKFSVTFKGFDTLQQAKCFLDWYEGQGEQDSGIWLEENSDLEGAYINLNVPYEQTKEGISCTIRLRYKEA